MHLIWQFKTENDKLRCSDGTILNINKIETKLLENSIKVYNFEVENWHNYFAGESKVLVHNNCAENALDLWRKFWTNRIEYKGIKVYQRNDIINPKLIDKQGRTNVQRMKGGIAPLGPDGESINLHHMIQTNESAIAEVSKTFHQQNSKIIHINPNTIPSGIDRTSFNKWKRSYWKNRAKDF